MPPHRFHTPKLTGGEPPIPLLGLLALIVCLIALGGAGCRNLYHETQSIYPADSRDRLKLRIEEAQQAEQRADQASATLNQRWAGGAAGPDLEPDVDRFEVAALDFMRRVASARDATLNFEDDARFEAELKRLEQRAAQMQKTVRIIRQTGAPEPANADEHETK